MKVLLIIPPITQKERYGNLKDVGTLYPALGLGYIASSLEKAGHDVSVTDSEAMGYGFKDLEQIIKEKNPDLVGMTTFCTVIDRIHEIATIVKRINKNTKVVLGGVHTTLFPEESIKRKDIDFIVVGEGDITIVELVNALDEGKEELYDVDGLVWKKCSKIIRNKNRELVNLDTLSFPARHLFPMEKYYSSANLRGKRTLNIMTSRGCPFRCAYCSSHLTFGKTNRFRSPQNIIKEIIHLKEVYKIDGLQFYDETFTINRKNVIELCKLMINKKLNIQWTCFTRVDLVDKELLDIMKEAGCYQIFYGVESGVQRLLDILQKDITLGQIKKALKLTREAKIESLASFMFAIPTETVEDSWQTIKFAIEIDPDYAQWEKTTPFPGNRMHELCMKSGTIITEDYSKYTGWNEVVYVPEGRTAEEIAETVNMAFRRFYLRPKHFIRMFNSFRKLPLRNQYRLIKTGLKVFFSRYVISKPLARRKHLHKRKTTRRNLNFIFLINNKNF